MKTQDKGPKGRPRITLRPCKTGARVKGETIIDWDEPTQLGEPIDIV